MTQNKTTQNDLMLIAAGSNVHSCWGNPTETVLKARLLIEQELGVEMRSSRLFQTPAFPAGSGPDFVNAVFACDSSMTPIDVLNLLHDIEARAVRKRTARWAARTLDLDLLAVGPSVLPDTATWHIWANLELNRQQNEAPQDLILPHPRIQDRAFVLGPLLDVEPHWRHPVLDRTTTEMWEALAVDERKGLVALT